MKLSERLQALSYLSPDEFKELEALEELISMRLQTLSYLSPDEFKELDYEIVKQRVKELEDLIKIYQEYSILEMPREVNQKFDQLIEKLDLTF